MAGRHAGRVAIVTGGASGIGQAIAVRLAAEGARVAILDIGDAAGTLGRIAQAGGEARALRCDITRPEEVDAAVEELAGHWGAAAILVHSAVFQFVRPFEAVSFDEWRKVQSVNVDSMFHLLQATLPAMRAAHWGRIVVVASSTFFVGAQGMTHYVTSKGALIGLVHGLSAEVGPQGITVNALAPRAHAHRGRGQGPARRGVRARRRAAEHPAQRRARDQAGVVSFLVSDDAAFMTGQTLLVDGGQGRT